MAFGLLALLTAVLLLIGAFALTVLVFEPGASHQALITGAIALMVMLAFLAAGIGWLGIGHGHRTFYLHPYRAL